MCIRDRPYTASFLDDVKSGFIKAYLPRTSVSRYIAGKAAACALSGGMALSGGALCGLLALWLVLLPRTARAGAAEGQGAELAALLLMLLFCGALWALVGMTLSALTDSRYIAYASPFVLFYLLVILYERYYDGLFVLYPREWLDPSPRWVCGRAGVAVLLAELGALAALAFARAARRRTPLPCACTGAGSPARSSRSSPANWRTASGRTWSACSARAAARRPSSGPWA